MFDYYATATEECTWQAGELTSYGNSTDAFWKEVEGRNEPSDLEKMIQRLEVWDTIGESWEDMMTNNSTSVTRSVWPFLANQVQICNTISNPLLSQSGTYVKIMPTNVPRYEYEKLVYFHTDGQYLKPNFQAGYLFN